MSTTTIAISELNAYKDAHPGCVVCFSGDTATIYTEDDIPEDMRTSIEYILVQDFRDRFTKAETDLFLAATKTDNNVYELFYRLSTAREPLYLKSETLQKGMLYLVVIGVLTEARRIEILS